MTEFPRLVARVDALEGRAQSNATSLPTNEMPRTDVAAMDTPDGAEVAPAIADDDNVMAPEPEDDDVIFRAIRKNKRQKRLATRRRSLPAPADVETIAATVAVGRPATMTASEEIAPAEDAPVVDQHERDASPVEDVVMADVDRIVEAIANEIPVSSKVEVDTPQ